MINAIALDDEPLALEIIRAYCTQQGEIMLDKTFVRPSEALEYISKFPVDLIFLDIQMPSVLGVDFAQKIPKHIAVIFTTAHSQYAVDGFNLNAVDYLLKPFSFERFEQAVKKVIAQHKPTQEATTTQTISIRADYSLIPVALHTIKLIEGLDDYIKIHIDNRSPIVARMTMKGILQKLPESQFIRIHRSFIVPVNRIESMRNKTLLVAGKELPIGSSYEQLVKTQIAAQSFPA
ncbi:MAG: LytR/AlgR family response regulator transcription factor [Bacteroidia bacterium]